MDFFLTMEYYSLIPDNTILEKTFDDIEIRMADIKYIGFILLILSNDIFPILNTEWYIVIAMSIMILESWIHFWSNFFSFSRDMGSAREVEEGRISQ